MALEASDSASLRCFATLAGEYPIAGAWQMRPLSRGYVEAKSNRPGDAPAIIVKAKLPPGS